MFSSRSRWISLALLLVIAPYVDCYRFSVALLIPRLVKISAVLDPDSLSFRALWSVRTICSGVCLLNFFIIHSFSPPTGRASMDNTQVTWTKNLGHSNPGFLRAELLTTQWGRNVLNRPLRFSAFEFVQFRDLQKPAAEMLLAKNGRFGTFAGAGVESQWAPTCKHGRIVQHLRVLVACRAPGSAAPT